MTDPDHQDEPTVPDTIPDQARMSAAVPAAAMWRHTVLIEAADGREESFSIGPDGYVWCFEVAADGHGAGRLISTGLRARVFAVGRDGTGALVVVAADDHGVQCVTETASAGPARWTAPRDVTGPGLVPAGVERIVTLTHDGRLFVAFLLRQADERGDPTLRILDSVWSGGALVVRPGANDALRTRLLWGGGPGRILN